jgi:hypothetical protein
VKELATPQMGGLLPAFELHGVLECARVQRAGVGVDEYRVRIGEQRFARIGRIRGLSNDCFAWFSLRSVQSRSASSARGTGSGDRRTRHASNARILRRPASSGPDGPLSCSEPSVTRWITCRANDCRVDV